MTAQGERGDGHRGRQDPYAAFRVGDYRRYALGWSVAMVGTRIQATGIGWEMYQRTGQALALALGMVGLVLAVPTIALALPAGYLADAFDRRRWMMLSLMGMTVASLVLAALSSIQGPVLLMYGLLFLDAAAVALGRPARTALSAPGLRRMGALHETQAVDERPTTEGDGGS